MRLADKISDFKYLIGGRSHLIESVRKKRRQLDDFLSESTEVLGELKETSYYLASTIPKEMLWFSVRLHDIDSEITVAQKLQDRIVRARKSLNKGYYEFTDGKIRSISQTIKDIRTNSSYLGKGKNLNLGLEEEFTKYQEQHGEIETAYKPTWFALAQTNDRPKFLELPKSTFILAAQAYEFATQSDCREQYFEGFNQALTEGSVEPWAKTIIEYFKRKTEGNELSRFLGGNAA